jgi:hypothetical protein
MSYSHADADLLVAFLAAGMAVMGAYLRSLTASGAAPRGEP